ncbi:P-loop containing nucleoside triphosphate hydrolase protein, partial [Obba rivulosa]
IPSLDEIRQKTQRAFGRLPCLWQAKVTRDILKGDKDVICVAPTGLGKTLTFWMPLLFRPDGIQIVVTPLNILGTQNQTELAAQGISAEIEEGKHRVILVNPEELMKDGGRFEQLWKKPQFTSRIISVVWDEAHCISSWSSFRPEYKETHRLRYMLPHARFLVASATLADPVKTDVMRIL